MPYRALHRSGSGRAFFKLTLQLLYAALLALVLSATASPARADLGPPDLAIMQALQTTYGWGPVLGWESANPCPTVGSANWAGVTCNKAGRVVIIVAVCGTTLLNAPIPPILAQLTGLTSLDIRGCGMTGEIPIELTTMTQLARLRLDNNALSGTIPDAFATMPNLGYFSLENNQLTGAIPLFPNETNEIIRLGGNFLTEIPAAWTTFNREVTYNCYPSLPPSCDSQSSTNECTPNRQDCPSTAILSKVSGDGQRTQINAPFANPLVVWVTDFSNNPIAGATVTFSGPGISTLTAITDGNGNASANVTAGSVVGGNTVTASIDPNTMVAFGLTAGAAPICGTDIVVTNNAESGSGTLMEALADVCPGGTVDLSGISGQTIALSSGSSSYNFGGRLYIATDITLQGAGVTINGTGATRIFFVQNGNVTLNNLTLSNGLGQGGTSQLGGSAAGLGGAIFENGGNLTLNGVVLSGNSAVGGSADNSGNGAGGGFGANSTGGDLGGIVGTSAGAGGIVQGIGGIGGFGGGGGEGTGDGWAAAGGGGGFGGGAGGALIVPEQGSDSGTPGYGGGPGVASNIGISGGSGAGFGGAIFLNSGALNLINVTFTGNSAVGGTGAQGKGGSLFLYSGASLNMIANSVTFSGDVAAAAGAPGQGYSSNPYNNGATCPGVDTVDVCGILPSNTLTVAVTGNGAVTDGTGLINCPSGNCSALFENAAVLTPVPAEGYVFSGWSGGCSGVGSCTVSLAAGSASVIATFVPGTILLANETSSNLGSTSVCASAQANGCGVSTALTFNVDESVTLATPTVVTQGAAGLDFNLAPNGFSCANGQCTVQVNFTPLAPGLRLGAIRFLDTNNHVLSTSFISGVGTAPLITFAPAVSQSLPFSGLDHPLSLAVDAAGNVFAADYQNRVLELPAGGGPLMTVPVTGIGRAFGVAVDGAGDLFIADYYNQQVVEVPAGGGAQVTLPLSGLQGPSSVAVDGAGDVFVSDLSNQVFEVPVGGGAPVVIGSGWNNPRGLAVDGAGDLFVADSGSGNVLEVPAGNSQTVTVASGFSGPVGIAVDAAGDVFVADTGNNRVVEVPAGGCPAAGCSTVGSGFSSPWGVAVDGAGNIYVADTSDSQIAEVLRPQAPTLNFQSTAFGTTSSDSPQSVTIQNNGNAALAISGLSVGSNFSQTLLNGTTADCTGSSSLALDASCNLSISFTPAGVGPLTASATLTDNSFGGNPVVQTITLNGTGVAVLSGIGVTSSESSSSYGQAVFFTASVRPSTATGTVQFLIDGVNFGAPAALSGGLALSGSISTLAVGTHTIEAFYSGDIGHSSVEGITSQIVNLAGSSVAVALTGGVNPSTYGAALTFTATISGQFGQVANRRAGVNPQTVTGSVIWSANTGCGSTSLTAGTATCTTAILPGGSNTVSASYGGDGGHIGNSGSLGEAVNLQTPVVTVTSVNPSSEVYGSGAPATITATLTWTGTGAAPTGGLSFKSSAAGSFAGSPSCATTGLTITCMQSFTPMTTDTANAYTISANYAGNANYNPASSTQVNNFSITQSKITPIVTMATVFPNAEPYGAPVGAAITATISWSGSGPAPTAGKGALLSFSSNAPGTFEPVVCLGKSSPIVCGTLFVPVAKDAAGVYTITASYAGDSTYSAASSTQTNNFTITTDMPAVRLTPNLVVVAKGSTTPVTLTVTFTGAGSGDQAPTGAVTFSAASGSFGGQACSSSGDTLKCTVSYEPGGTLATGSYVNYLKASISAAGDYKAASGSASLTVAK